MTELAFAAIADDFTGAADLASIAFLQLHMAHLKKMHLAALFLDRRRRLIAWHELFRGTVDEVDVYPREVVRDALDFNASCVVLVRNDPSGELAFSESDVYRWERLRRASELVGIEVLDVLLVGAEVVSCAEMGWL
jgi:DNA repair protein RadC